MLFFVAECVSLLKIGVQGNSVLHYTIIYLFIYLFIYEWAPFGKS